jgi:hypothetical protein
MTVIRVPTCILAFGLIGLSGPAYGHRPTMSDGTAVDADHAIELQDVQISRVVYHEVTKQAPQVWITFEVDQPQELFLQIGVPVLDRLRKYRPTLALIGPGLPDPRLPFECPKRSSKPIPRMPLEPPQARRDSGDTYPGAVEPARATGLLDWQY